MTKDSPRSSNDTDSYSYTNSLRIDDLESNIVGMLRRRAVETPNKTLYVFLDDNGREERSTTFAQIDSAAARIATSLQKSAKFRPGDRVILCYAPGLDFIEAFWGCLYAGAIAVAVYPPHPLRLSKDLPRINKMVQDTGAEIVLTNTKYYTQCSLVGIKTTFTFKKAKKSDQRWPSNITWIKTDKVRYSCSMFDPTFANHIEEHHTAFLQFTSGATDHPKATQISHGNVYAQVTLWTTFRPEDTILGWLPPYHGNGLINFILVPVSSGVRSVQMSPFSFIKKPSLWMEMIAKYRAVHTCAPNFAYLLAAKRTSNELAASLDLTCLRSAACGAEPIKSNYFDTFLEKFAISGITASNINCCYGGAEATLVIACVKVIDGVIQLKPPTDLTLRRSTFEQHKRIEILPPSETYVSADTIQYTCCGAVLNGFELCIVDPVTHERLVDGRIGEIWVHGASMTKAYWRDEHLTKTRCQAKINGDSKEYFRMGDYGFLHDGELFFVSRMADAIHIQRRMISPQHIEATVEAASSAVRPGCVSCVRINGVAIGVVAELKEDLRLVVNGPAIAAGVCKKLIQQIWQDHRLTVESVTLIQPKTLPKTTSGKLQRQKAKELLEDPTHSTVILNYRN